MSLLHVQNDAEWVKVRQTGRFSVEADCLKSERHALAALKEGQDKFVAGKLLQGYVWLGPTFTTAVEPHLDVFEPSSLDANPDDAVRQTLPTPGELAMLSDEARERWGREMAVFEQAEKARAARKLADSGSLDKTGGLVDLVLTSTFKVRVRGKTGYRAHIPYAHELQRLWANHGRVFGGAPN